MTDSKSCVYCERDNDYRVCLSCDGKHVARSIFKHLKIAESFHLKRFQFKPFMEDQYKQRLMEREIKGLQGLDQGERNQFKSGFDIEWSRLKEQEYQGTPHV